MKAVSLVTPRTHDDARSGIHVSLLDAALRADVPMFLQVLRAGADIHAVDASGRTVLGCAIAGERWEEADASDASFLLQSRLEIVKALLHHDKISLTALNAPLDAMRGVTPLGLASWLNIPEVVRTLLCESPGLVSVNGMDASGATPLMYAARDGRIEVIHALVANGARPDYRDVNHRSSVQYALRHPQALWLCESALRRHRMSESARKSSGRRRRSTSRERIGDQPRIECHPRFALKPSKDDLLDMVAPLISAVQANDSQGLAALLEPLLSPSSPGGHPPPLLVNHPDAQGWSAIHYCVTSEAPSLALLDALYDAGADLSLYTRSGHGTPLHCLARQSKASTAAARDFVRHLVLDLRAPLGATDAENETCLHILAEHGHSMEVLLALLDCDITGAVQEMRNSRGLTPLEVARPVFKVAFGRHMDAKRSASSASTSTIKASAPAPKLSTSVFPVYPSRKAPVNPRDSIAELNIRIFPHGILENLETISHFLDADPGNVNVNAVEELLKQTTEMGEDLLVHMQGRLNEAAREFTVVREELGRTRGLICEVPQASKVLASQRHVTPMCCPGDSDSNRRRTTEAHVSERIAASRVNLPNHVGKHTSEAYVLVSVPCMPAPSPSDTNAREPPPTAPLGKTLGTSPYLRPSKSLVDLRQGVPETPEESGLLKLVSPWVKDISRKRSKSDIQAHVDAAERSSVLWIGDSRDPLNAGVSKVKAWLRRKLMPEVSSPPLARKEASLPPDSPQGRPNDEASLQDSPASPTVQQCSSRQIDVSAARVSRVANADIQRIAEYVELAERYISHANRNISNARRLLTSSIERRKIQLMHAKSIGDLASATVPIVGQSGPNDFLPVTIPSSPRDSQLLFPKPPSVISSTSSIISSSGTVVEDDEDIPMLRRLLTRKIEARTDYAFDHLSKAALGLRIVKDVARTLRRNISS